MQTEILTAAASIIVTFIVATWRWSASQIKRFDQMMVGVQNEVGQLRDDNNQQISQLRDDNSRLRSEVRGDIKEVREDVHKLDNRIARQEGMIRALWSGSFKGDPTLEPAFPQ